MAEGKYTRERAWSQCAAECRCVCECEVIYVSVCVCGEVYEVCDCMVCVSVYVIILCNVKCMYGSAVFMYM